MRRSVPLDRIHHSFASDWSLDATEVETRRIEYGPNDIIEKRTNQWLTIFIDTAKDPMIWFLIIASLLFASLKNYNEAIILLFATIPLIGMDAFLHWRTQVSTKSLTSRLASKALVIRNGIEGMVAVWEIVPGDLVVVPTGQPFPADGLIIAGKHLQVDESALTGESFPVQKDVLPLHVPDLSEPSVENRFWGFAGTRLLTGRAMIRIVYTGQETVYGEIITSALQSEHDRTPLQKSIFQLVFTLIIAASIFCLILAIVRYLQGFGIIDAILSAATLAVAALPDEFPIVFTVFLGVGVYRLARKKALVKHAVSVENIGRITCICSDKTGTLTEGLFRLVATSPATGIDEHELLKIALFASRSEIGDPLDLAILNASKKYALQQAAPLATFPFTEDRKRETAMISHSEQEVLVVTKGAPETILALTTLSEVEKDKWRNKVNAFAHTGYKVIACAYIMIKNTSDLNEPVTNYTLVGLLAFSDPPRKAVPNAINWCYKNSIHVLMITGDHPETAKAIANQIGLGHGNPTVLLAKDIPWEKVDTNDYFRHIDVIARAVPSEKLDIVTALQSAEEIVAVTGDGVNDVPALTAANIGIAMGERGTQSAREVADIVLLDDNFDSIVNAIGEGRQLFKNLKLCFKYLLMVHIPFIFSAAIIPLLGYPLLYYPIHIVFIELIIHPTSLLVFQDLPQETSGKAVRTLKIRFFTARDWWKITIVGVFTTGLVSLTFLLMLYRHQPIDHARSLALAMLAFTSAVLTIGLSDLKTITSRIITFATIVFTVIFIQIPEAARFFNCLPLSLHEWSFVVFTSLVTLFLIKV